MTGMEYLTENALTCCDEEPKTYIGKKQCALCENYYKIHHKCAKKYWRYFKLLKIFKTNDFFKENTKH